MWDHSVEDMSGEKMDWPEPLSHPFPANVAAAGEKPAAARVLTRRE